MITQDLKNLSTIKQFQFELHSWIRLVEFLNQENTYLKNRLSEVIDQIKDIENLIPELDLEPKHKIAAEEEVKNLDEEIKELEIYIQSVLSKK